MATITAVTSQAEALHVYSVTLEQLDAATMIVDEKTQRAFYLVKSASDPEKEYRVTYNTAFSILQCTCPAGSEGRGCWHKRAALADWSLYRMEQRRARLAEQAAIEATPEYQEAQREIAAEEEAEHASSHLGSIDNGVFCNDINCPCHDDTHNYHRYCIAPYLAGLATIDEQNRIYFGKQ